MRRTWGTNHVALSVVFLWASCRPHNTALAPRECSRDAIIAAVGAAVTTGDAELLTPAMINTRDLAEIQGARLGKPDTAFESKVRQEIGEDVAAWARLCKGGVVRSTMLGKQHHGPIEGFAKPLDVLEDSIVHVFVGKKDVPVRIQYMFANGGCWRLVELGKPHG